MDTQHRQSEHHRKPRSPIAWPTAHLLALAPIDVWVRMLARSDGVKPRYWGRLGFLFVTSLVGTACTMHERVVLRVVFWIQRWRGKGRAGSTSHQGIRIEHEPGAVVILGYYRSGTTHLHNLMSCDRRLITPRWYQCLAGQGFVFGWTLIRFILVPFLGGTRPQDAVGFGPSWPAEDDFAMASWGGCSSLPGRFIWPSQWDDWKRWHGLEDLNEKELHRWRSLMAMYVWKLTRGKRNRSRVVLLKTPSHTARVAQLDRLFKGHVKFVHLVREPGAVIDSNVRLHDALKGHLLEDAPDVQTVRDRVVEEYAYSEGKCNDELGAIDPDRVVRIRYQDLRADGVGTLKTVYDTLGLGWDEEADRSAQRYLGSLGKYDSAKEAIDLGLVSEQEEAIKEEMVARYGLDEPTVEAVGVDMVQSKPVNALRGILFGLLIAGGCALVWLGVVWLVHWIDPQRHVRLVPAVWVCGALIGMGMHKAAGNGSRRVGLVAAGLSVLVVLAVAFPTAVINYNFASTPGYSTQDWLYHNAKSGFEGLRNAASIVFIVLGAMTAYRHGSACGPTAPGQSGKIRA